MFGLTAAFYPQRSYLDVATAKRYKGTATPTTLLIAELKHLSVLKPTSPSNTLFTMANFQALVAAIVLSFAASALATPVARSSFITHPISKVSGKNVTATITRDLARIANFNSDSAATSSATVTNQLDSYVAAVKVGSQTFSLIVDTGSSNTWVGASTKLNGGTSTGKSISVSYGSGSFSGTEYTDTGLYFFRFLLSHIKTHICRSHHRFGYSEFAIHWCKHPFH